MRLQARRKFKVTACVVIGLAIAAVITFAIWPAQSENAKAATVTFSNLFPGASRESQPISELAIGQTRFTTFGEPESAPNQMVPLARGKNSRLCISRNARTWNNPAEQVGNYAVVNLAIKRTGESTYEVIASDEMAEVITRNADYYSASCIKDTRAIITTDPENRKVLGLVEDMEPGDYAWVPANGVWVADKNATRGYLLTNTTRQSDFPRAVLIFMGSDRTIVVVGPKKHFELVGATQIELLDEMKDRFQEVVIA